jgi:hypothetical protein
MRLAGRHSAMMEMELLLFRVGGVRLATPLERVACVLTDVSILDGELDAAALPFHDDMVPILRAENVFDIAPGIAAPTGALILFRGVTGLYAVAVDEAVDVLKMSPGDRFFPFLPGEEQWSSRRRPWGFVEIGDVPVLLFDPGPVRVH